MNANKSDFQETNELPQSSASKKELGGGSIDTLLHRLHKATLEVIGAVALLFYVILEIVKNQSYSIPIFFLDTLSEIALGISTACLIAVIFRNIWEKYQQEKQESQFKSLMSKIEEDSKKAFSNLDLGMEGLLEKQRETVNGMLRLQKQMETFLKTGLINCYSSREKALIEFLKYAKEDNHSKNADGRMIEVVSSSAKGLIGSTLGDDYAINSEWRQLYQKRPSDFKFILTHPAMAHLRRSIEGRSNGHIELEIFRSTLFLLVEAAKQFLFNLGEDDKKNITACLREKACNQEIDVLREEFSKYVNIRYYRGSPTVFTVRIGEHLLFNPYSYGAMAKDMLCLEFQLSSQETPDIHNFYTIHFNKTWQSGDYGERLLDGKPIVSRVSTLKDVAEALVDCQLLKNKILRLREKQVLAIDDYYKQLVSEFNADEVEKINKLVDGNNGTIKNKELFFRLLTNLLNDINCLKPTEVSKGDENGQADSKKGSNIFSCYIKQKGLRFYPDPETQDTLIVPLREVECNHINRFIFNLEDKERNDCQNEDDSQPSGVSQNQESKDSVETAQNRDATPKSEEPSETAQIQEAIHKSNESDETAQSQDTTPKSDRKVYDPIITYVVDVKKIDLMDSWDNENSPQSSE